MRPLILAALLSCLAAPLAAEPADWRAEFPRTDFGRSAVDFAEIVSGGPPRDGIPALSDPRFRPVQPDEAGKIRIEISVLTEPQPLAFDSPEDLLGKLKPHEDGVVLTIGQHGATFLPQVWEQLPDKAAFLDHLSQKAGCDPSAWRGKDTSVAIYRVEAFQEPD